MPYLRPRSQSAKLDVNGATVMSWQIDNLNQRWIIDYVSVQTDQPSSATPIPTVRFTLGQVFVGGSQAGNLDVASGRVILYPDDVLTATWAGGVPGSTATATIAGTFDPAGLPLQD